MKSIFEQHGGTYTMQGDYRLPNLLPPTDEERPIGVWGQRRLNYLKHHRKVLYYNLLTSGKLHSHLADIEEQVSARKRTRRKRRHHRTTQSNQPTEVGTEDE